MAFQMFPGNRRKPQEPADWRLSSGGVGGGLLVRNEGKGEGGWGGFGGGVGTGKGTSKSMRTRLAKVPFSDLPFSFPPK